MTTLPVRAPAHTPLVDAFARIVEFVDTVFSVFEEAQTMARAAHERYPFAE